jgi:hypothetical protein
VDELGSALVQNQTLTIPLPALVNVNNLALGARDTLTLGDRTQVFNTVAASTPTTGRVETNNSVKTRAIVSGGTVGLGNNTQVTGDVTAGKGITKPASVQVTGTVTANAQLAPAQTVSWTYPKDTVSLGNVVVNAGQNTVLSPGTYTDLTLTSQGTLRLRTGVYVFRNINIYSQGRLVVDGANGPVQVYGSGTFNFQGVVSAAQSGLPQLIIGLSGGGTVTVQAPFTGVLLAPNATLSLQAAMPQGHRAVFYGKVVSTQPDTIVRAYPFDWTTLVPTATPPANPNAVAHPMPRSPLDNPINVNNQGSGVDGTVPGEGTTRVVDSPTPITFTLPAQHPVEGGTIGNGTVTFTFGDGSSTPVTCTYRGGAGTATPATAEELNAGRYLDFDGCSDGSVANSTHTATHFETTVNPVPGYSVTVDAPVTKDGACSEEMEFLTAYETTSIRSAFSWDSAPRVAETNPDGTPALYYAYVYLSNANDAVNLRKLRVHALNRPLFDTELAKFAGKCGAVTNPGDGDGVFVPAILPGVLYNRLLDARTAPNLSGNREVFEAVVLRHIPDAARNPNQSLRYDALANARFKYLDYEQRPLAAVNTITQYAGADPIAALVDVIDWVGQGIDAVVDGIERGIGAIALVFADSSVVTFNINGVTLDTAFASNVMVRGWGPLSNQPLGAPGLKVTLVQGVLNTPIPMSFVGHTNANGRVTIEAVRQSGSSSLCVELKNEAAMVTDFLWATEVCDFRASDRPGNVLNQIHQLDGQEVNVGSSAMRLLGFYQADDAFRWARDVTGFSSRRGTIMSGYFANTFSTGEEGAKRLYAPCLTYTNIGSEFAAGTLAAGGFLASLAAGAGTPLGPVVAAVAVGAATLAEILGRTDIMMPTASKAHESREVMTHEYGHFLFCGMMHRVNPPAVENLVWSVMLHGEDQSAGQTYANEAFADFITGQVVGAADYTWLRNSPPGFVTNGIEDAYCNNTGPCFDKNQNNVATEQTDDSRSIGRTEIVNECETLAWG